MHASRKVEGIILIDELCLLIVGIFLKAEAIGVDPYHNWIVVYFFFLLFMRPIFLRLTKLMVTSPPTQLKVVIVRLRRLGKGDSDSEE